MVCLPLRPKRNYICSPYKGLTRIAASSHCMVVSTQAYVKPTEYLVDQDRETGLTRIFYYFGCFGGTVD